MISTWILYNYQESWDTWVSLILKRCTWNYAGPSAGFRDDPNPQNASTHPPILNMWIVINPLNLIARRNWMTGRCSDIGGRCTTLPWLKYLDHTKGDDQRVMIRISATLTLNHRVDNVKILIIQCYFILIRFAKMMNLQWWGFIL